LAGINYIKQQVTRCQFSLNERVTRRGSVITWNYDAADRPVCKERRVVLRNTENTTRYFTKTGSYFHQKDHSTL